MADPTEEPSDDDIEADGGPVKSFLDHLEDLRWLLIKSAAALLVGMIICLYGTTQIVAVLKYPLRKAALVSVGHQQKVLVSFETNNLVVFEPPTNRIGPLDLGSNRFVEVRIEPIQVGTNILLSLKIEQNPTEETRLSTSTDLVYLDPAAPFMSALQLALYGGVLLGAPFIFYFLAQFILPALKIKEKKYVLRACAIGSGLFLTGVSFCYFFVLARALKYAEVWALWMGVKVPEWRAETYFSFVTKFMLGMGLGFELPVVLLALVNIGVLDHAKLVAMRRYMIVVNLILGALLTTPEVFTQLVMGIMLQILYEISVMIAWYWERQDRKREASEN